MMAHPGRTILNIALLHSVTVDHLGELQLWAEEAICRDEKTASKVESQLGGVNMSVGERLLQRSVGDKLDSGQVGHVGCSKEQQIGPFLHSFL